MSMFSQMHKTVVTHRTPPLLAPDESCLRSDLKFKVYRNNYHSSYIEVL